MRQTGLLTLMLLLAGMPLGAQDEPVVVQPTEPEIVPPAASVAVEEDAPRPGGEDLYEYTLDEKALERLAPEAREAYEKALMAMDRVDHESALHYIDRARRLDPDHAGIRLLSAEMWTDEAALMVGTQARNTRDKAVAAYQEALALDGLSEEQRREAREGLSRAVALNESQAERDARRRELGQKIVEQKAARIEARRELRRERSGGGGTSSAGDGRVQRRRPQGSRSGVNFHHNEADSSGVSSQRP